MDVSTASATTATTGTATTTASTVALTVRLVRSFEYRTFKNLYMKEVSLDMTVQQLAEEVQRSRLLVIM